MKIFITGGSGFIGTNLALHYAGETHQVTVLAKQATDTERENAEDLRRAGVEVVCGDIRDRMLVERCCEGAEVVYHIAAAMREANISDRDFRDINVKATRQLLEVSKQAGVRRFVHCSSIGAMGWEMTKPANETSPCRPRDIYQVTKRVAEDVCLDFWRTEGLPISIVRPADVYGPRDRRLLKLFKGVQKGRFAMIGSGRNEHHMVFIEDLITGFVLASQVEAAVGQVFIVAGEEPVQLNCLVSLIARELGVGAPRLRVPLFPLQALAAVVEDACKPFKIQPPLYRRRMDFFRTDYAFDISKAKQVLGYQPRYDLQDGLGRTLHWYREAGLL